MGDARSDQVKDNDDRRGRRLSYLPYLYEYRLPSVNQPPSRFQLFVGGGGVARQDGLHGLP